MNATSSDLNTTGCGESEGLTEGETHSKDEKSEFEKKKETKSKKSKLTTTAHATAHTTNTTTKKPMSKAAIKAEQKVRLQQPPYPGIQYQPVSCAFDDYNMDMTHTTKHKPNRQQQSQSGHSGMGDRSLTATEINILKHKLPAPLTEQQLIHGMGIINGYDNNDDFNAEDFQFFE